MISACCRLRPATRNDCVPHPCVAPPSSPNKHKLQLLSTGNTLCQWGRASQLFHQDIKPHAQHMSRSPRMFPGNARR